MVSVLVVEVPAASTKRFHTEVAKITKKNGFGFNRYSFPAFSKVFVIFAISV
jgi:hypothetical protein